MKRETIFNSNEQGAPKDPMVADLVNSRGSKSNRIENSPFRRIPAVTKFIVKPGEYNILLAGSGLERKLKAEIEYELEKVQTTMNKHLKKEIRRMKNALKNGKTDFYWDRAEFLMKNSVALRVSALNTVMNGWYKNRPIQEMVNTAIKVENILRNNLTDLKYFRVEIPKGKPEEIVEWFANNPDKAWPGKMRPLGVPTVSWRVVLHMWNGFLTMFLENELKQFNHAYMPRVGTSTALRDLVLKVLDRKYIYEFDIKGFFNNVDILDVIYELEERGMPQELRDRLEEILMKCPQNLNLDEDSEAVLTGYDRQLAFRKMFMPSASDKKQPVLNKMMIGPNIHDLTKGLPQGAAPSTILSLLALAEWYKELKEQGISLLMYADDGILYSDEPFEPTPPDTLEFAEEKSRWIRKGEEIQVDELKFLGVKYDFKNGMLKGATRNGSTLEFGKEQKDVLSKLKELIPSGHSCAEMPALVQSSIFGLALSKLYGGKFGKLQYKENQTFDEKSYWAKYHNLESLKKSKMEQRLASTIACGWLKLIVKHTMGKRTRSEMHAEVRQYEGKFKEEIDLKDISAAYNWDIWNSGED